MSRFDFWHRWLWWVSLGLVAFGVGMAVLNRTFVFAPINRPIDAGFWNAGVLPNGVSAFQAWIYGAWGATVAGWGLTAALLVRHAFARHTAWAWWALVSGVGLWYVLDTAFSAAYGVWPNVLLNTVLLVLFALPLTATRWDCLAPPAGHD
jgi:hypothetical protein